MRQGDMSLARFETLLSKHIQLYGPPELVSLQGEGEPTLHPKFFDMARHTRALGIEPYTITNGSYRHPEHFVGLFSKVGVSVDTLDEITASHMGRHNLPRVLEFIQNLAQGVKVVIHSVAHEIYTPPVALWCAEHRYQHVVQPLQTKADYRRRYSDFIAAESPNSVRFSCPYLTTVRMRYYALDGTEMPCCYIKDSTQYRGLADMMQRQEMGEWPSSCNGCRFGSSTTTTCVDHTVRRED